MGIRRRSVFTAGSISRRELGRPGAVAEATFETLDVESVR
jgi:hypothetical protein